MVQPEIQPQSLREVEPGLDKRLQSIAPLSLIKARLSKDEIIRGLSGEAGAEFFAKTLNRHGSTQTMIKHMGDNEVQDALVGMIEKNPQALPEAIEQHADTRKARRNLGKMMGEAANTGLYERIQSTAAGNEVTAMAYDTKMSWDAWGYLNRGVKRAVLHAKIKLPIVKHKESVIEVGRHVRPVTSNYLDASDGGLKTDEEITGLLTHIHREEKYGAFSEFFTTQEKTRRLSQYLETEENRDTVTALLSDNKPRALLSIMDALVTGLDQRTGINNFADMLVDKNGSQVVHALVRGAMRGGNERQRVLNTDHELVSTGSPGNIKWGSLDDQELLYAAFNSVVTDPNTPGEPGNIVHLGKEVMRRIVGKGDIAFDRAIEIQDGVNARRKELHRQGALTKIPGDINIHDDPGRSQLQEIRQTRPY